jgi:hypothetical protein
VLAENLVHRESEALAPIHAFSVEAKRLLIDVAKQMETARLSRKAGRLTVSRNLEAPPLAATLH